MPSPRLPNLPTFSRWLSDLSLSPEAKESLLKSFKEGGKEAVKAVQDVQSKLIKDMQKKPATVRDTK